MPETVIHWHIIPKKNIPLPKNGACLEMVIDDPQGIPDALWTRGISLKIGQNQSNDWSRSDTLSDKNADKRLAENLCVGLSKYLNSGYILFEDIKKFKFLSIRKLPKTISKFFSVPPRVAYLYKGILFGTKCLQKMFTLFYTLQHYLFACFLYTTVCSSIHPV